MDIIRFLELSVGETKDKILKVEKHTMILNYPIYKEENDDSMLRNKKLNCSENNLNAGTNSSIKHLENENFLPLMKLNAEIMGVLCKLVTNCR